MVPLRPSSFSICSVRVAVYSPTVRSFVGGAADRAVLASWRPAGLRRACGVTTYFDPFAVVVEGGGLRRVSGVHLGGLGGIRQLSVGGLLAGVLCGTLGLAALFGSGNHILVLFSQPQGGGGRKGGPRALSLGGGYGEHVGRPRV